MEAHVGIFANEAGDLGTSIEPNARGPKGPGNLVCT